MSNPKEHIRQLCYHCGDECGKSKIQLEDKVFCCQGCQTVYGILNSTGLCEYYHLNQHPGITQLQEVRKGKFDFLDNPEIANRFIQFQNNKETHVTFYLPQIHCSSCLWLLENIHKIEPDIISSRVHFTQKEITLIFKRSTSLKNIAELLTKIGYEPSIQLENSTSEVHKPFDRNRWLKIGVTGFCFGNIMMLSIPDYTAGGLGIVEKDVAVFFKGLSILLSLPVLFFGASEFFISAYKGLKQKFLNIDAPVALAILIAFSRSLYEILSGIGSGYLDSMSGIVFFMLIGRWLQDRTYNTINFDRDYKSFFPIAIHKKVEGLFVPIEVSAIVPQDVIQIHHDEILPVDAILSKGDAIIDYSFVTGESTPVKIQKGEIIYAGGKQKSGLIELVAIKPISQSYLTRLWNKSVFSEKEIEKENWVDMIAKYFTYIVLVLGVIAFAYWYLQGDSYKMWNALTTVLIVACPCALLLAENFTYANMLRILNLNQFYAKNKKSIDKIRKIKHIVFDKTGTLTQHNEQKIIYEGMPLSEEIHLTIASMALQSVHPIAYQIQKYLNVNNPFHIEHFKEFHGQGMEAWVNDKHFKIGIASYFGIENAQAKGTELLIYIDQKKIGSFLLQNQYRFGIEQIIKNLKTKFQIALLSGDNSAEQYNIQEMMGHDAEILFNQTPENKLKYIEDIQNKNHQKVMMIGDGLNDAGALKQSDVGITVCETNNLFTPSCDAVIEAKSLNKLPSILNYCFDGKKIILIAFIISAIYNVVGLIIALQGTLSPLIAAILMPCSSITIVFLTYVLSNRFAKKYSLKIK
ncbi:MAG TPA: heavy metal translocating P-type ATPase metal-binding domain-containing protein [Chitinophagaceae bacterium]|nr:heavy metal translocating P-type ATPase metal-binding domain-containing protein [Chitinophagaceae bacterium]